jgi:hypothetical protein
MMILSNILVVAIATLLSVSPSTAAVGTSSGARRLRNHDVIDVQAIPSSNAPPPTTTKNMEHYQYSALHDEAKYIIMLEQTLSEDIRWLQDTGSMSMEPEESSMSMSMSMMASTASTRRAGSPVATGVSMGIPIIQPQTVAEKDDTVVINLESDESATVVGADIDDETAGQKVEVNSSASTSASLVFVALLFLVPFFV